MKKRILALSLALTLALSLTPAMAAGTADKFPAKNAWTGFADVGEKHWAASGIKICYETGLMTGKSGGFDPEGTVTMGEAMAVAARVGATLRGERVPASTDKVWYSGAVVYLKGLPGGSELAISGDQGQQLVTRWGFFHLLSIAVPENALAVKNTISSLPDTDDDNVLRFYNAGVLTGVNDYGTFSPGKTLSRAEMAAMVSRIARPATALLFTPKTTGDPSFDPIAYYTGTSGKTHAIVGKDYTVNMMDYLTSYMAAGNELVLLCREQGVEFSWGLTFEDGTTLPDMAMTIATRACLLGRWEADHGSDKHPVGNLLGAKHILVDTKEEADALRAQLKAAGDSVAKFDELMNKYSKDGRDTQGNLGAPDGYTFGPGEMVAAFESGAKALNIGQISAPIQSEFGYHIILRTEPEQSALADQAYSGWLDAQSFQYSDALLGIDLPAFYDNYSADLAK